MHRITIAALLALCGCASSGSTLGSAAAPQTIRVGAGGSGGSATLNSNTLAYTGRLAFSVEDAFRALPAAFDSLGIAIALVDPATHVVSNQGMKVRQRLGKVPLSRYIECGTTQIGPNADSYEVYLTVTTQIAAEAEGSTIATTVEAVARPLNFAQEYSRCSSRGVLEPRIAEVVKKQLAS